MKVPNPMKKTGSEDENKMFPHKKKQLEKIVILTPVCSCEVRQIYINHCNQCPTKCLYSKLFFQNESKFCCKK